MKLANIAQDQGRKTATGARRSGRKSSSSTRTGGKEPAIKRGCGYVTTSTFFKLVSGDDARLYPFRGGKVLNLFLVRERAHGIWQSLQRSVGRLGAFAEWRFVCGECLLAKTRTQCADDAPSWKSPLVHGSLFFCN